MEIEYKDERVVFLRTGIRIGVCSNILTELLDVRVLTRIAFLETRLTPDDVALDFMTESEIAEIMATEDIFQVDMTNLDDLLEDVATDSDYE